jgi:formate hydrogenlyase subunit 3/multisubunit Na+/H+ antiporter MnhD subunit
MASSRPEPLRAAPAPTRSTSSSAVVTGMWLTGAVMAAVAAVMVLLGRVVYRSYTAPGPGEPGYGAVDPHGYGMIFGSVLLVGAGLLLLALTPLLVSLVRRVRRGG